MRNKKGFIRTIEAVIAIVIIVMVIFFSIPTDIGNFESEVPVLVQDSKTFINSQIFQDEALITLIFNDEVAAKAQIETIIANSVPPGYAFKVKICDTPTCIEQTPADKQVYMGDLFIGSTLKEIDPHIVRYWMWPK